MEDFLGGDIWHVINLLLLMSYILVKELILDRRNLSEKLKDAQSKKEPLKALEIDLGKLSQKVISLEDAIADQGDSLSAKLDMIFADFKEKHVENKENLSEMRKDLARMSDRLTAVETELKLKPNRRK